jgi:hypothetical protein
LLTGEHPMPRLRIFSPLMTRVLSDIPIGKPSKTPSLVGVLTAALLCGPVIPLPRQVFERGRVSASTIKPLGNCQFLRAANFPGADVTLQAAGIANAIKAYTFSSSFFHRPCRYVARAQYCSALFRLQLLFSSIRRVASRPESQPGGLHALVKESNGR